MRFSTTLFYLFAALIAVIPAQVAAGDNDGGDNGGDGGNNPQRKPQPPSSCPPDSNRPKRPDHPDHDQRCDKKKHDGDNDDKKVQVLWGQCGGCYYDGTTKCPEGSYCRYFSDWYSQCNPNDN